MRENTSTEWVNKEVDSEGNFNRQKNQFETPFGEGEGKLPVEPGRYRLCGRRYARGRTVV